MSLTKMAGQRRGRSGSVALEFALVAPILIVAILGTAEVTSYVQAEMKLRHSAQMLAMMAAESSTLATSGIADLCQGASAGMAPYDSAGFKATVAGMSHRASGESGVDWSSHACGGGDAPALLANLLPVVGDGVIAVSARYDYKPLVRFFMPNLSYILTETVYDRPRVNHAVTCADCS